MRKTTQSLILALSLAQQATLFAASENSPNSKTTADEVKANSRSYGYATWVNGFRKNADDKSPDLLSFETGYYDLVLNLGDLTKTEFSRHEGSDYATSIHSDGSEKRLAPAELLIQVAREGRIYTASHCLTGSMGNTKRLEDTLMWESGRYFQHFDLQHLVLEDSEGNSLYCDAKLEVASWPSSLTLTAEITPELPFLDGPTIGVSGRGLTVVEKPQQLEGSGVADFSNFTLETWVNVPRIPTKPNDGWILSKNGSQDTDGHIGFHMRGNRIDAVMNIGGGHLNRHRISEAGHKRFDFDGWHQLVITYDGETMHYYVDGYLQSNKKIKNVRKAGSEPITLCKLKGSKTKTVYGAFDQIRVWDRVLTEQEIRDQSKQPEKVANRSGLQFEKTFDTANDPQLVSSPWRDVTSRIQFITKDEKFEARSESTKEWKMGETHSATLSCDFSKGVVTNKSLTIDVHTGDGQTINAAFNPEWNCHLAEVKKLKRSWKSGYTDIRDYDEFTLEIENKNKSASEVPFVLYLRNVANITGLVPLLCYEDGTPTGIPVQLSKNWHEPNLGSYMRACAMLPATPGKQSYKLRIAYGFYGSLPSASHAQLSLIGYGGNSRWDQLAIGCWGETICFDVDRSLVDVAVTDVRMLMARQGAEGKKWSWTEAGWGGDWLRVDDAKGNRHHPNELKTAYLAHGPCLTDARYAGHYGTQKEIGFKAKVQTLRTDDYARTFQKFHYTFDKESTAKESWLFKMGRTYHYATPKLAYGNNAGLIKDMEVPTSLKKGDSLVEKIKLEGSAPWWVSFPGAKPANETGKGNGYRALVIRSYRASFGGKVYTQPSITSPVYQVNEDGSISLDLLLTAPAGVEKFLPGDTLDMDLEWVTLHREADDYYGPNGMYRKHLEGNPNSWKTIYREAVGNDLEIEVKGGKLLRNYPIEIETDSTEVSVQIKGGVGYVPIRFDGLASATGYTLYQVVEGESVKLDQAVHGNDFWQTDYDAASKSYSRVYNLPLDGLESSEWVLKKDAQ
ncbi:LamG domain-containing protein [Rubritalea sp.]|uniref:LamG domain-containing protein n=1 Tax=Rubritalea sp. TaxID=2109375 RepID=UPI003EF59FAF